jgi:cob(I)alamin adenosyltransferase
MLYTGKGDDGKTGIFGCDQRFSKSSVIAEALGTLDEVNSFLGICKTRVRDSGFKIHDSRAEEVVHKIQENLFIIQAQVAGADKKILKERVLEIEKIIKDIENELPPIRTFFISGSTEESALFDFARTLARRAERRVVAVSEEGLIKIDKETLTYLNRLSSLLYALARLSAGKSGKKESSPKYS